MDRIDILNYSTTNQVSVEPRALQNEWASRVFMTQRDIGFSSSLDTALISIGGDTWTFKHLQTSRLPARPVVFCQTMRAALLCRAGTAATGSC